ncbi:type II secretion system inner membrane protein GspF [Desulfofustis limnaeus]|uniref:General secretion pathway protein F n=1 Tax=Desulfofustis limnaeus TaxID=2740163 RepID=A0ABM7W6W0_9BACT|nr:type II secretion system inner membrane protein GspF [Desulfofustis limnaeus]BDD86645.1 type II secretion system protein GspF [Desulfofustis limnaeus]
MPVYEYEALLADGRKSKGIIDADSEAAVRTRLRGEGKYPVAIRVTRARTDQAEEGSLGRFRLFERVKAAEIHLFTRQLATLLGAGIPLDTALNSIVEQTENPALQRVTVQLKESVSEGEPLSRAMQRFGRLFPNMYINMVRAGEASGGLDRVLSRLADFGEKQEALKARLRAALVYPLFMAVVGAGILFILITYIVPNITRVFDEMGQVLPVPTVLLIGLSSFLRDYWWLLLTVGVGCVVAGRIFVRRPLGKYLWDMIKLRTPVWGPVMRKSVVARFSSTMESLLGSGVEIIRSLEIVKRIIDNVHVSATIDRAIEDINKGKSMAAALSGSAWFPPMFVQMVAVGETSGQLEEMLAKVAAASERDVEAAVLGLTSLIEPIMIVSMGAAVGFIVLSILLPIFEMNQMIG